MIKKKLFKKKNNFFKNFFLSTLMLIIFFLFYYYYYLKDNKVFLISSNDLPFYSIPEDKGGQEIPNQDKKGLHLSYGNNNVTVNLSKNNDLKFSIQIFSDSDYRKVNSMRIKLLEGRDSIYDSAQLSIAILDSILGKDFLLLYENFDTRKQATDYCQKYIYFIKNCLIVNFQNLD